MKRLVAPKSWLLHKMGGVWAPRPSTGPHAMRESLPLTIAVRNRLKYALTRREVMMIVMRRLIAVDGKVRTDFNYPAGFMDVISIEKTREHYRVLYDVKGRFFLHKIDGEETKFKLLKVVSVSKGNKATIGRNPTQTGQAAAIPYVTTHDGRTIRYVDPLVKRGDTVKFELAKGAVTGHIKFEVGNTAMVTKGANIGRVGVIKAKEKHPGSFDIVHLVDKKGNQFATRSSNVFVIGDTSRGSWVSLPKAKGQRLTIMEERAERAAAKQADKKKKKAKRAAAAAAAH
jgi:small subunit ribosomal protein S4e